MKSFTVVAERCVCSLRSQKIHSSWGSALAQGWEFCFQKSQVREMFYFLCLPWCISTGCSLTLCLCLLLWKVSLKQHACPVSFTPSYLLCVSSEEFLLPSITLPFISLMSLLVTFLITLTKYAEEFILRYSRKEHSSSQRLKHDGQSERLCYILLESGVESRQDTVERDQKTLSHTPQVSHLF